MKKPIDPNLENFDTDDFILDGSGADEESTETSSYSNPQFMVSETDGSSANPEEYHASESHRQRAADGVSSSSSSGESGEHRHHHSSSSSHHHHSSSSSGRHHHHHHRHHHRHHKRSKMPLAARIIIAVLAVILAIAIAVTGTFFYLNYKGEKDITTTAVATDYAETIEYNGHTYVYNDNIITLAFIGVDKRNLGEEDSHSTTAGMADTDVVVAIDKATGKTSMISIPRDTMVDVDVYKDGKFIETKEMELCIAYAYGDGFASSCKNVTKSISRILYNVPVDKYFAMDLNGIQPINDAVGGVDVTSLYDLDEYGIKKGDKIHLEGDLTEAYVRTRDMDNIEASLNRTERQVQYLNAFANKVRTSVTHDFGMITDLYNTASEYCTTDITISNATYLGSLLISKGVVDFDTYSLEGTMKEIENKEFADYVYAGFYPDEEKLMQTVLDVFYTQVK